MKPIHLYFKRYTVAFIVFAAVLSAMAVGPCVEYVSSFLKTNVAKELPESMTFIVLGHDTKAYPLERFAEQVEEKLQRKVVSYRGFSEAGYLLQKGKWWEDASFEQTMGNVELALRRATALYPGHRTIIFNLDTFDPKELYLPVGQEASRYTNYEVKLLLHERPLFLATRWFLEGRELTLNEAEAYWAPTIERLNEIGFYQQAFWELDL